MIDGNERVYFTYEMASKKIPSMNELETKLREKYPAIKDKKIIVDHMNIKLYQNGYFDLYITCYFRIKIKEV